MEVDAFGACIGGGGGGIDEANDDNDDDDEAGLAGDVVAVDSTSCV